MSQIMYYNLDFLGLLSVNGKDAAKFLQGQCTQDISRLEPSKLTAGAFCTAKGRAVTNVWLVKPQQSDDCIYLLCHQSTAEPLTTHLKKYIPFFRGTTLSNLTGSVTLAGFDHKDAQEGAAMEPSLFTANLTDGRIITVFNGDNPDQINALAKHPIESWHQQDIFNKVLWLQAEQIEAFIPQNFGLDELGGISYKKGCYTGQEVIARLHYKGQSKKQLYRLSWPQVPDKQDANLYDDKGIAGTIVQMVNDGTQVLALAVLKNSSIDNLYADENRQSTVELLN